MIANYTQFCERMSICRGCENYIPGRIARCKLCGCVLELKLRMAGASCPLKKF